MSLITKKLESSNCHIFSANCLGFRGFSSTGHTWSCETLGR